jgi:hypothetical protein
MFQFVLILMPSGKLKTAIEYGKEMEGVIEYLEDPVRARKIWRLYEKH